MQSKIVLSALRSIAPLLVAMMWIPALGLQKTGRFDYFGSMVLPALVVIGVFTLLGLGSIVRLLKRKPDREDVIGILFVAALNGWFWTPVFNVLFDFSAPKTVDGEIVIKRRSGRGQDHRKLTVELNGQRLTTEITPGGYWEAGVVRIGGPCRVQLRRGAFGVLRPAEIRDR